jgi:hypothetical protein
MKSVSVVLLLALMLGSAFASEITPPSRSAANLNDQELLLPANYRSWVALSPTATGMPTHQHHHVISKVYVEPSAYDRFVKHGSWPNQTVIVLELRKDKPENVATKCNLMGLEVAVKDDSRTPDPWTYYGIIYDHDKPTAASEPATCKECEAPVDMRLAMYFPALRAVIHAKPWTIAPSLF